MYDHYWGMHFWWWVFWVVFLLILSYYLIRDSSKEARKPDDPLEILKRRYARGEISKEEYEEMKKDLE